MRAFSLFVFAIVIVLGIPRLANKYYGVPQLAAKAPPAMVVGPGAVTNRIENQSAINAAALPRATSAVPVEKPAAVRLVPVSLQPIEAPAVPVSQVPAIPASGKERVSAIQNELSRLGYYNGPSSGKWSRAVRSGAREFIRHTGSHIRNTRPSLELLESLRAADFVKPEVKTDKEPPVEQQPIRQAEVRPKESPVRESAATPEPASSDDYLPPWMTRAGSAANLDASSAANYATPPAVSTMTGQVHQKRHRREREWDAFAYSSRRWRGESYWSAF